MCKSYREGIPEHTLVYYKNFLWQIIGELNKGALGGILV